MLFSSVEALTTTTLKVRAGSKSSRSRSPRPRSLRPRRACITEAARRTGVGGLLDLSARRLVPDPRERLRRTGHRYVYEALYAGASGFLLKDVRRDDLVHAVRVVASGDSLLAPSVTRQIIADITRRHRTGAPGLADAPDARLDVLTARERETLHLLGRGLSNAEIAETLVVSEHTVKTHVSNVLTKLGLRDRAQAVICAYETGLITAGEN